MAHRIPSYARVEYEDVYPGVNLVFHGNQGKLEYDFVVRPGADPGTIRFAFKGAEGVGLDNVGNLIVRTTGGHLIQPVPIVYQEIRSLKRPVAGRYVIDGQDAVRFQVADYDVGRPLVIDPVLNYSTYLGGSGREFAGAIAVDAGSVYVTGFTVSLTSAHDFPTASPLQPASGGGVDVFVAKLNPSGTALVYSTYLGGSDDERGDGIAVDISGNAYVTGSTESMNFPTVNPMQPAYGGGDNDVFVAKLNATGSALVYSTYLGGGGDDRGLAVAVDASGNAYVTGLTTSTNFPTANAVQATFAGGGRDVFVAKLNAAGAALAYSTYLGGSGFEDASGIALDGQGSAYVTGFTTSANFPTVNAFQSTLRNGSGNGFVTKLNPLGSAFAYSTYLGGSGGGGDEGVGIAVDATGNAYVTGNTSAPDFPTTPGVLQPALKAGANPFVNDAFVAKLNATGAGLVYSTYLGGSGNDISSAIAVDTAGNAHVVGSTGSSDFPTASPLQGARGGTSNALDAFVAKVNSAGSALMYSTYLGASGDNRGVGIAVDSSGAAYVSGQTNSPAFPTTGLQRAIGGDFDAFIVKIVPEPPGGPTLFAAVLPSSRSVQVGKAATAFATIIAAGATDATSCSIKPLAGLPAAFFYQTTDPATNALTGTPNTPVNIRAGEFQTFVLGFTPTALISPVDVQLAFNCGNTGSAAVVPGLDTLSLSAAPNPVPDIVALVATLGNNGIVNIPGATGTGVFAVATIDVGAGGTITAVADTGSASLPVLISICQTNPVSSACLAPPRNSVTVAVDANATPTFGVFITGHDTVPFNPATNRVFVRFASGGITRGSTSVAVQTE